MSSLISKLKALSFLFILVTVCSLPRLAIAESKPTTGPDNLDAFAQYVEGLRDRKDFNNLEILRSNLLRAKVLFPTEFVPKIHTYYAALANCPNFQGTCARFPESWLAQEKHSPGAEIVAAKTELMRAWGARGTSMVQGKDAGSINQFATHLANANKLLGKVAKTATDDPWFYLTQFENAALMGAPEPVLKGIFESGIAVEPRYYDFYEQRAQYLMPRWYGNPGDVERFADEIDQRMEKYFGKTLYADVANTAALMAKDDFYKQHKFSWPRIKAGFEDWIKRDGEGENLLGNLLFHAYLAQDRETVLKILAKIEPRKAFFQGLSPNRMAQITNWIKAGPEGAKKPPLIAAILNGDDEAVAKLLSSGLKTDSESFEERTPLYWAIIENPRVVPLLVEKGGVDLKNRENVYAAKIALLRSNVPLAKYLVAHGASGINCYHIAVKENYLDFLKYLIKKDNIPNESDIDGKTPLMLAAELGKEDAVEILLNERASEPNFYFPGKNPPALYVAVQKNNRAIANALLKAGANPKIVVPKLGTAYDVARSVGSSDLLKLLESYAPEEREGSTPQLKTLPSEEENIGMGEVIEEEKLFEDLIASLFYKQEFDELEKLHATLLKSNSRLKSGLPRISVFYDGITYCPQNKDDCLVLLKNWGKKFPSSAISHTAVAKLLLRESQEFNKGKTTNRLLGPERLIQNLKDGWEHIRIAKSTVGADPETFTAAYELSREIGLPENISEENFKQGTALDPIYEPLWISKAHLVFVSTPSKLEAFAKDSVEKTKSLLGKGLYGRIAYSLSGEDKKRFYSQANFSWEKISAAYKDLLERYPLSRAYAVQYLELAALFGDRQAAKDAVYRMSSTVAAEDVKFYPGGAEALMRTVDWARGEKNTKTTLIPAIRRGDIEAADKALRELEDINQYEGKETTIDAALNHHPELVSWVLDRRASPHGQMESPPIVTAIERKDEKSALLLLAAGADMNAGGFHKNPLSAAIKNQMIDLVKVILARKDLQLGAASDGLPLVLAIRGADKNILELLLKDKRFDLNSAGGKISPLCAAIELKDVKLVNRLLSMGANPDLSMNGQSSGSECAKQAGDPQISTMIDRAVEEERKKYETN